MTSRAAMRFRITDLDTEQSHVVEPGEPEKFDWGRGSVGWSLGTMASGSAIEIDEPLEGLNLGIFAASHHKILIGEYPNSRAKSLPEFSIGYDNSLKRRSSWARSLDRIVGRLPTADPIQWLVVDPTESARSKGELYVRFDRCPLKIGGHVIEFERNSDTN
jgi:hypothetical protein